MFHPDYELSPDQHKLSQHVVEFLIEHQDWFLLDIPPPPRNDSIMMPAGTAMASEQEVYMVPSESDEDTPMGGWKLVEKGKVRRAVLSFSHP